MSPAGDIPGVDARRDLLLDAVRGVAAFAVVMIHAVAVAGPRDYTASWLHIVPYSFANYLFFATSGYLMFGRERAGVWEFIRRRASTLLVPYFAWTVIWWVVSYARGHAGEDLLSALWGSLVGVPNEWKPWFLWVLFVAAVVFRLVILAPRPRRWLGVVALVCAVAYVAGVSHGIDVLEIERTLLYIPFFIGGYLVASGGLRTWLERRWSVVLSGVAWLALLPVVRWAIVSGIGTSGGVTWAAGESVRLACSVAACAFISSGMSRLPVSLKSVFAWVGVRTLGVYVVHKRLLWGLFQAGVTHLWVLWVLGWAVSLAVTEVMDRIPVVRAVLLGRRGKWRAKHAAG